MLKTILVPLDGSELAERALDVATGVSIPTGAQLVLIRAVTTHALPGADQRAAETRGLLEAEAYLTEQANRLAARGFRVQIATPYGESAASWIVEEAGLRQADLIVMSTHGRTGPGHLLLGSVAESVVAHSPIPVLLDRAWHWLQRELLLEDQPRLLVPLDGSPFGEAALGMAAGLADDLGAELVLLRVEPGPPGVLRADDGTVLAYVDQLEETERLEGLDYLEQVKHHVQASAPAVDVRLLVRFGPPAARIAEAAAATRAALVVMATHGRTGLRRAVLGSVAGRVLHEGTTPLVLVRPPRAADGVTRPAESAVLAGPRAGTASLLG